MKRQFERGYRPNKQRKQNHVQVFEGTNDQVLRYEISKLLGTLDGDAPRNAAASQSDVNGNFSARSALPERFSDLELEVLKLSSTGDALAVSSKYPDHIFVVPFCLPGETALGKVTSTFVNDRYSTADFIRILMPSAKRRDDLVGCNYFSQCSGCQLQMMAYDDQLKHKQGVVEQAYQAFSKLDPKLIPKVEGTLPSPMQYGYRTKLTPHFDGSEMERVNGTKKFVRPPTLGYTMKGRKRVMEIEDCPIGTDVVRKGLLRERKLLSKNFDSYKNGATILLRESTTRVPDAEHPESFKDNASPEPEHEPSMKELILRSSLSNSTVEKRCISDMNGEATEYIDDFKFQSRAGSFFQNNNSILSSFTAYIRDNTLPKASPSAINSIPDLPASSEPPIKYLLDAYCGSGLFTITLSSLFTSSLGVDVDPASIHFARLNATANSVPNTGFIAADASALFSDIPFPAHQTVVVIDPPRKGCSEDFLRQLLEFGPKRVVYVSCNVHTQARDVGMMVRGSTSEGWKIEVGDEVQKMEEGVDVKNGVIGGWKYEIESLRGCDFFPQTGHVEGVAILNRIKKA